MDLYKLTVKNRNNEDFALKELKGKVLLIVNTATGCGFTPQYEAIEALYEKYHDQGFEVLDFPCNQFGHQAPGTDAEIKEFCTAKYQTKFDQLKKVDVNGENESPVFTFLKAEAPDEQPVGLKNKMAMKAVKKLSTTCKKKGDIVWNFTKFIVDRNGRVAGRFDPTYDPAELDEFIEGLL
ncbi:glutathione peroxidase [Candidatus Saccharibacteria bacterium]|nr:glutathione peroxidase [Candidatus Saccharibacteria bacterium]